MTIKLTEVGRMFSAANLDVMRKAMAAIASAMETMQGLMSQANGQQQTEALRPGQIDALLQLQEEMSHNEQEDALRTAIAAKFPTRDTWVRDVYQTWLVFADYGPRPGMGLPDQSSETKLYRLDYSIDANGVVTLGNPGEVRIAREYVPVATQASEAGETVLIGDLVPLAEARAVGKDGAVKVKVIAPGWGSSGYYSADVLKRDGPAAFPAGTKMFWNHPTPTEEAERPERDLRDLAAVTTGAATWLDQGPAGPGLYAESQVMSGYRQPVNELAPYIGTSIRALGRAKAGEAEGRQGAIIEAIVAGKSVDFVTTPGAGGQILQLFEAARNTAGTGYGAAVPNQEDRTVDEKEAKELRESMARLEQENARMREAMLLREAQTFAGAVLAGIDMPDLTRTRLLSEQAARPAVKDGKIDEAAYRQQIETAAAAELEYLQKTAGLGQVRGMGSTGAGENASPDAIRQRVKAAFVAMGLSEAAAERAAA